MKTISSQRVSPPADQREAALGHERRPQQDPAEKQLGMGCLQHAKGVAFRVWAPHADSVAVVGDFNDWDDTRHSLTHEEQGYWYIDLAHTDTPIEIGQEYRYTITNGDQKLSRVDPYAREVTNSIGNGVVHDPHFDWQGDDFQAPTLNEMVIYELHVGTFHADLSDGGAPVGDFDDVAAKLEYLAKLGINVIQIMPTAEFAGDFSWGYNPSHIFAVESAYGGPAGLKRLVREAHKHGIAVLLDVVYNHFGPSDLNLWQFDGWSENEKGGIYFYNDWRCSTPWGDTRPDYGRGEVRNFIRDNALMWIEEFHMDGLRYDMTLFVRTVDGTEHQTIPEGWSLAQWINRSIAERKPRAVTIAEDLQNNDWLTKPADWGGAGFDTQWDAGFVHPIRAVVQAADDKHRSMHMVKDALCHRYNLDAFERVIYSESHDEVANGKQRVPSEIDGNDPTGYYATKRSTLAAAMVFTAPGVPMIFQGQEFLRAGWFDDTRAIDWRKKDLFRGIVQMYRDLISLRRNRDGISRGLTGQRIEVSHLNDIDKVIAFRRWWDGEDDSDVFIVANFSNRAFDAYRVGVSHPGPWKLRFNSDAPTYSDNFGHLDVHDLETEPQAYDHRPQSGQLALPPYSTLIFSRDA